ncbi:hypothetical protein BJ508DRAFT_72379 [Ascobolus immersus RN42]|uniref:Uncharacterized protein n=1 Tax=Ascobolus immersus RN42 TaxID=1160509 RepID=A0A3N4HL22_ASCIM|nr:hypothetical protein BJ508DRAFT_72379 [Ascobolus immersus RN42]
MRYIFPLYLVIDSCAVVFFSFCIVVLHTNGIVNGSCLSQSPIAAHVITFPLGPTRTTFFHLLSFRTYLSSVSIESFYEKHSPKPVQTQARPSLITRFPHIWEP